MTRKKSDNVFAALSALGSRSLNPRQHRGSRNFEGQKPSTEREVIVKPVLEQILSEEDIEEIFRFILERETGNQDYVRMIAERGYNARTYLNELMASEEFHYLSKSKLASFEAAHSHSLAAPTHYRVPSAMRVGSTGIRKVLAVGSCFLEYPLALVKRENPNLEADIYLISGDLPQSPEAPIGDYQFQIVQPGLRYVLPDLAFAKLSQVDISGHKNLLDHAINHTARVFESAMKWNRESGILTFVLPFPVPQQDFVGRLMPRYDLRNPVYFIEKLNEALSEMMANYTQTYLLDANAIAASLGKRFSYEDMVNAFNHGGLIGDFDFEQDAQRLETPQRITEMYSADTDMFSFALWNEAVAMYRTARQTDSIKLVVIDLDDTLWRGIIAETDPGALPTREGWPLGFWEALMILKRRGVLLAIISKNEEARVREMWPHILGGSGLQLEDFAITRINWRSKSDNMAEILAAVNLLPGNVLFIDDNPAQRDDIQRAFPEIRVMGGVPNAWRHILLWAPETQVASISTESSGRTAMVQAQVEREVQRRSLSNEEFLQSLGIRQTFIKVDDASHPRFGRILELINKTNQFNTTGQRWTVEECVSAFAAGTSFYAFDLADRFTEYGLVGVLIVDRAAIRQFVMSCRIMGLDAELAAVAFVSRELSEGGRAEVIANLIPTDRNLPCRAVYSRCGFIARGNDWVCGADELSDVPAHIALDIASLDLSAAAT